MSVFRDIGELGEGILDAATDFIEGTGDTFQAQGRADLAKADAIRAKTQIDAAKAVGEETRKNAQQKLLTNVVYISLAGILIISMAKYVVPLLKK